MTKVRIYYIYAPTCPSTSSSDICRCFIWPVRSGVIARRGLTVLAQAQLVVCSNAKLIGSPRAKLVTKDDLTSSMNAGSNTQMLYFFSNDSIIKIK